MCVGGKGVREGGKGVREGGKGENRTEHIGLHPQRKTRFPEFADRGTAILQKRRGFHF